MKLEGFEISGIVAVILFTLLFFCLGILYIGCYLGIITSVPA